MRVIIPPLSIQSFSFPCCIVSPPFSPPTHPPTHTHTHSSLVRFSLVLVVIALVGSGIFYVSVSGKSSKLPGQDTVATTTTTAADSLASRRRRSFKSVEDSPSDIHSHEQQHEQEQQQQQQHPDEQIKHDLDHYQAHNHDHWMETGGAHDPHAHYHDDGHDHPEHPHYDEIEAMNHHFAHGDDHDHDLHHYDDHDHDHHHYDHDHDHHDHHDDLNAPVISSHDENGDLTAHLGFYDMGFSAEDSEGRVINFSDYRDKIILIVNVASQCGYTHSNYMMLQQLFESYHHRGFQIFAFPCNDFGHQEPGTQLEIMNFVKNRYGAEFVMMKKIEHNNTNPLFMWLRAHSEGHTAGLEHSDKIDWNFNKFLLDHWGHVVRRYNSADNRFMLEEDIRHALDMLDEEHPNDSHLHHTRNSTPQALNVMKPELHH